jgi:hypothetical protein
MLEILHSIDQIEQASYSQKFKLLIGKFSANVVKT